eukprot:scaffold24080_cov142-Cylindrotheca_fusiformis.AAC.2
MTAPQEEYLKTIDTLKVENQALKEEVAELKKRNTNQANLLKRLESWRQEDRNEFEKQLTEQVAELKKRNTNQANLLKRLESSRQEDRNEFEKQLNELKEALSQERIKSRRHFQDGPLSPSASNRSLIASPPQPPRKKEPLREREKNREVTQEERNSWKQEVIISEPLNGVIVQSHFLDAAIKKKEAQRGFWGKLFNSSRELEPKDPAFNESMSKITQESGTSTLTKDIMAALEENERLVNGREGELRAPEAQRVKENALKIFKRVSRTETDGSQWKLLRVFSSEDDDKDIGDSPDLNVDTIRRLIADRTAVLNDKDIGEGKEENFEPEEDENDNDGDFSCEDEGKPNEDYTCLDEAKERLEAHYEIASTFQKQSQMFRCARKHHPADESKHVRKTDSTSSHAFRRILSVTLRSNPSQDKNVILEEADG